MVYGCGNKCVKYLVFLFNFLVFVIGIVILGLTISVLVSSPVKEYFQAILNQNTDGVDLNSMNIALYVLIAIGALLMLTGFLGCCGAWCENTCLLSLFFSIILILFVAELACGIAILVNKDQFKSTTFTAIADQMGKYNSLDQDAKNAIDNMQTKYDCCGCNNSTDYTKKSQSVPASCQLTYYNTGCCAKVWNDLESQLGIVGGVAIGILVIELLAMIFSCILCQAFRRGDYQYA